MDHRKDTQYTEHTISLVKKDDEGFEINLGDSTCIHIPNPKKLPAPVVGETIRLYGKGFGFTVRGAVVNENVYYYRTEDEDVEYHQAQVRESKAKKREEFEANRAKWESDILELPKEFQDRIQRFVSKNPDWEWDFGPYELFCCKEAVKIVNKITDVDELCRFYKASIEDQKTMVPELEYNDHSGNTFGTSVHLARVYLEDKDWLPRAHGALCPLVGCEEYGCYAAEVQQDG